MVNRNFLKSLLISIISLWCVFANAEILPKNLLDLAYQNIHDNPEKSIEIAHKLYNSSDEPENKITSLLILAQAYTSKIDYNKSFEFAFAAQKIAEENNDYNNQIIILSFISRQYYHLRITDQSWEFLRQAESLMQKHPIPKEFEHIKGSYYLQKGYLFQSELNCENAIYYFEKAIKFYKNQPTNNEVAQINLAFSYGHKAHCLIETGNYERAEIYLHEVSSRATKLENKGLEIFAKIGIAKVHHFRKEFNESNQFLISLLEITKNVEYKELSAEIYRLLAENYLSLNDIQKHYDYQNLYEQENIALKNAGTKSIDSLIQFDKTNNAKVENIIYDILIALLIVVFCILYWKISMVYSNLRKMKRELRLFSKSK